mmetsp:Transcript_33953/g.56149  ORF Transcript_33953/g.56149 Transcript_33953/m.56149 type:complete len:265 (-) Transcript_33953:365-1159(-)
MAGSIGGPTKSSSSLVHIFSSRLRPTQLPLLGGLATSARAYLDGSAQQAHCDVTFQSLEQARLWSLHIKAVRRAHHSQLWDRAREQRFMEGLLQRLSIIIILAVVIVVAQAFERLTRHRFFPSSYHHVERQPNPYWRDAAPLPRVCGRQNLGVECQPSGACRRRGGPFRSGHCLSLELLNAAFARSLTLCIFLTRRQDHLHVLLLHRLSLALSVSVADNMHDCSLGANTLERWRSGRNAWQSCVGCVLGERAKQHSVAEQLHCG